MANKSVFQTLGRNTPKTDAVNAAGGKAYKLSPKAALARYAATGCISNTYYVKAKDHLDRVIDLAKQCEPMFIAKLAVYSRKNGFMKDMPALLCAHLATRGSEGAEALKLAFPIAIDNGTMLTNFIQIIHSGALGRKSLGSVPKKLCQGWFAGRSAEWVFRQLSIQHGGFNAKDVLSVVHPKGKHISPQHDALFGYWLGKVTQPGRERFKDLPKVVKEFEGWKANRDLDPPRVDFRLLDSQKMTPKQWAKVIRNQNWHAIKKNINTADRNGAFDADKKLAKFMADKIKDPEIIKKVRVMPGDLLAAYKYATNAPRVIVNALHDAMEQSVLNAPVVQGKTLIIVDVSGSMGNSISGWGMSKNPSKVRCVDVAALFAVAMLRNNDEAVVLPVDTRVHTSYKPEPRNTILSEANKLARFGGGGTALSAAFYAANQSNFKADSVIVLSDQESWQDGMYSNGMGFWGNSNSAAPDGTQMMVEWEKFRRRNKGAKLVCIDIVPGITHQTVEGRKDILHVSGWNDSVFKVVEAYLTGEAESWLDIIQSIQFEVS